jgi:selenocysteine-specific elongation factor
VKAIVGTAGHIDHGKTALVRALTGIDTDRLPEERARGISIELGFAYLDLGQGDLAGIVDVPGHERFIRQMLAGAQGFDLVLLVVAADDGVMPQTEEHFEICHLLGVRAALFVITKCDLVSPERLKEVAAEIEILAAGTAFEHAPIVPVSAQTGEGIEALRKLLASALASVERPVAQGAFRMPIDRAFVLKGHGVVVTGTAAAGSVAAGDDLEIVPGGRAVRVRELQVHDRSVERAFAGQRVALNLSGVERDGVRRGDCMVARGSATASDRFDAAVEIRPSARKPVSSHAPVRVYVGTRDAAGKLIWLDGVEAVAPRGRAYAQIVLEEPAAVFARDRFIVRDAASLRTLGGGTVLLPRAPRHPRSETALGALLRVLESGDGRERISALVRATRTLGVPIAEIAVALDQDQRQTEEGVARDPTLVTFPLGQAGVLVADRARYDAFVEELMAETAAFHRDHPSSPGIDLERLRAAASHAVDPRLLRYAVDDLVARGRLLRHGSIVALPGHRVSMDEADEMLARRILEAIRTAANMPPTTKDLADRFALEPRRLADILSVLGERGATVRVSADLVFAREAVDEIERRLRGHLESAPTITAAEFRDLIDASRKYSIPLLDYFDRGGVTIRSGDFRRLRKSAEAS